MTANNKKFSNPSKNVSISRKIILDAVNKYSHPFSVEDIRKSLNTKRKQDKDIKKYLKKFVTDKKLYRINGHTFQVANGKKEYTPNQTHSNTTEIGVILKKYRNYFLKKENGTLIALNKEQLGTYQIGDTVIFSKKNKNYCIIGSVTEKNFNEIEKIFFKEHQLAHYFNPKIIDEIKQCKEPKLADYPQRKNFTDENVITIDPIGAKDHDDAISFSKSNNGWDLKVHIADVAEYVHESASLDKEALHRSFTRYLPWTAVPMLPEELANNLCSLKEGKERLALSCCIKLSLTGELIAYDFIESIIKVKRFYNYEEAQEAFEKETPFFLELVTLAKLLKAKRKENNIIDFHFPEPKVQLNSKGEPESIHIDKRPESYEWIEDFMLIANRCCAKWMKEKKLPTLYRVHELPEKDDLIDLAALSPPSKKMDFLKKINDLKKPQNNIDKKHRSLYTFFFNILKEHKKNALGEQIQRQILQTMKKAVYSPKCVGHFALGFLHYAHYTSPIRRYPDLWNHRYIKKYLHSQTFKIDPKKLESMADTISQIEITVNKLERTSTKTALAWILRHDVGKIFSGTIQEINDKGMSLTIHTEKIYGEAWVPLFSMRDDYYLYNVSSQSLVGKRTKKVFKLEDKVDLQLAQVSPENGSLQFDIANR